MLLCSLERFTTTSALLPAPWLVGPQGRLPLAPYCYPTDGTAGISVNFGEQPDVNNPKTA